MQCAQYTTAVASFWCIHALPQPHAGHVVGTHKQSALNKTIAQLLSFIRAFPFSTLHAVCRQPYGHESPAGTLDKPCYHPPTDAGRQQTQQTIPKTHSSTTTHLERPELGGLCSVQRFQLACRHLRQSVVAHCSRFESTTCLNSPWIACCAARLSQANRALVLPEQS
jgi:hypothetical protein